MTKNVTHFMLKAFISNNEKDQKKTEILYLRKGASPDAHERKTERLTKGRYNTMEKHMPKQREAA